MCEALYESKKEIAMQKLVGATGAPNFSTRAHTIELRNLKAKKPTNEIGFMVD